MAKIYEHLSKIYDAGWNQLSEKYVILLEELIDLYRINDPLILDLACGTGILVKMLALKGYSAFGIDISPQMIEVAKRNTLGVSKASFNIGNMKDFSADQQYDIITCTFDSINYLRNIDDIQTMFRGVANALNSNGFFIFDSNCEPQYIANDGKSFDKKINNVIFRQSCLYNKEKKESLVRFEFADGVIEEHYQRPYNYDELSPLLRNSNLNVIEIFSKFDKTAYSNDSSRLFCISQKKES